MNGFIINTDDYSTLLNNIKKLNPILFTIVNDLNIITSDKNIPELTKFLIEDIQLNEKRVKNTLKKFHNNYK